MQTFFEFMRTTVPPFQDGQGHPSKLLALLQVLESGNQRTTRVETALRSLTVSCPSSAAAVNWVRASSAAESFDGSVVEARKYARAE